MKVKTISYSQSRETVNSMGLKSWHKYSAEAELEEGEDPIEVSNELNSLVYAMHSTNMTNAAPPVFEVQSNQSQLRDTADYIIEDIQSCKSIKVLESYSLIAKSSPKVKEAYDKKYNELQNKQP